jgi:hypothetical protein
MYKIFVDKMGVEMFKSLLNLNEVKFLIKSDVNAIFDKL